MPYHVKRYQPVRIRMAYGTERHQRSSRDTVAFLLPPLVMVAAVLVFRTVPSGGHPRTLMVLDESQQSFLEIAIGGTKWQPNQPNPVMPEGSLMK